MNKERIKEIRKDLNLTQSNFGLLVGVGKRAVQKWESGENKVPFTVVNFLNEKLKGEQNTLEINEHKSKKSDDEFIISGDSKISTKEISQIIYKNIEKMRKDELFMKIIEMEALLILSNKKSIQALKNGKLS